MLSKKTKYAIKALVILGKNADKPPMQISRIAELERIPKKFLEQILLDLRNAGFLYSKKGAGGGYSLNKAPKDIYLSKHYAHHRWPNSHGALRQLKFLSQVRRMSPGNHLWYTRCFC